MKVNEIEEQANRDLDLIKRMAKNEVESDLDYAIIKAYYTGYQAGLNSAYASAKKAVKEVFAVSPSDRPMEVFTATEEPNDA